VSPAARAREIALEQTVEIPPDCFSPEIEERIVGHTESIEPLPDGRHRVVVSYSSCVVGPHFTQLVNLLFGNISMHRGIRLAAVEWPLELPERFRGPAFGIAGLRELCGVARRPLVCAAVKPLGLSVAELARDAAAFARGGADMVKDDHSLDEQPELAPFRERAARCQEAVLAANAATGGRTLYFPNLTGSPGDLPERVAWLRSLGVRGAMVSPMLLGFEAVRWLAAASRLALLGHPTFSGALFGDDHGIAPEVLFGQLFRLAGCDGVIFVNAGGRFAWSEERCAAIARALRAPLGAVRPAFPVPAGGVQVARVPEWVARYGPDTMVLIGGSFYQQGDLEAATAELIATLEAG
jgi:ribulose-bisphosphate carboxylase large chain